EELFVIAQTDEVWAALRVFERDLGAVVPGAAVEVRVPSDPDRVFRGTISFVGDLVDPVTRTAEARAALANATGELRPGMSATAEVALPPESLALWLPTEAVQSHDDGRVVFVRVGERRFEARRVATGAEQAGLVRVVSGIAPGDEVVVQGAFALRG